MEASQASEAGSIPVARSATARLRAGRFCHASATGTPGQPRTLLPSTRALTQPCGRAPGTKLPQHAALAGRTGTKLPQHPQNGPFQHVLRQLGELYTACATNRPSRANFIPHAGPIPVLNSPRIHPSGQYRYKTLPASGLGRPTRYKTLPASPKTPISAHFAPAGRTLYRFHHQHDEQGEKSHAPTPRLTHQCTPPPLSHASRLHEFSTKPRHVAIPTI